MDQKSVINRKEFKTRRGNIILRPTTWDVIQKILKIKGGSFNDLVSTLLEEYAEKNAEYIRQFADKEHKELI